MFRPLPHNARSAGSTGRGGREPVHYPSGRKFFVTQFTSVVEVRFARSGNPASAILHQAQRSAGVQVRFWKKYTVRKPYSRYLAFFSILFTV